MNIVNWIALIIFWNTNAYSAQETWGGDVYALRFVKIGYALVEEMKTNQECKLAKFLPADEFQSLLLQTNVSSLNTDSVGSQKAIVINRRKFEDLSLQMKREVVFKKYFSLVKKNIDEIDFSNTIEKCDQASIWKKLKNPSKNESVDLQIDITKDIQKVFKSLLETFSIKNSLLQIDDESRFNILNSLKNYNAKLFKIDLEEIQIQESPLSLRYHDGKIKDGLNTKDLDGSKKLRSISINKSIWRRLSFGEKKEFLFHEMAGLLNIPDQNYQLSSQLQFVFDEKEYRN